MRHKEGTKSHQYLPVIRKKVGDEDRIVISTAQVDHYGDRVMPEGVDLSAYEKNPVVLWLHDSYGYSGSAGMPIGKTVGLEIVKGVGITATGIDWLEGDPFVDRIKAAWDQGMINAASIGFIADRKRMTRNEFGGYDIHGWKLLEWSLVPVPANPGAVRDSGSVLQQVTSKAVWSLFSEALAKRAEAKGCAVDPFTKKELEVIIVAPELSEAMKAILAPLRECVAGLANAVAGAAEAEDDAAVEAGGWAMAHVIEAMGKVSNWGMPAAPESDRSGGDMDSLAAKTESPVIAEVIGDPQVDEAMPTDEELAEMVGKMATEMLTV